MQYADVYYLSAHSRHLRLQANQASSARDLSTWLERITTSWPRLQVRQVTNGVGEIDLGERALSAEVFLDTLTPDDVTIQVLTGRVDASGEISSPEIVPMSVDESLGNGCYRFQAALTADKSGLFGYAIRVLPHHLEAITPFIPGLILWASSSAVTSQMPDLVVK